MADMERNQVASRVAESKARLSDRLQQLAGRVEQLRNVARPVNAVRRATQQPWVVFAIGVVAGLAIGARRKRTPVASTSTALVAGAAAPSLIRAVMREIALASAGTMTRRYLARRFPQ